MSFLKSMPVFIGLQLNQNSHLMSAQYLLEQLNHKLKKQVSGINKRSLTKLSHYNWPGNIRELQNILEREVILSNSKVLDIQQSLYGEDNVLITKNKTLAEIEKNYILEVLTNCKWRIGGNSGAAEVLGLPASTLRSRMKKLGIKRQ